MCPANRAPLSCEITPTDAAGVKPTGELLAEARPGKVEEEFARRLIEDLAYRSGTPEKPCPPSASRC